jgi:transposase InsO family protein
VLRPLNLACGFHCLQYPRRLSRFQRSTVGHLSLAFVYDDRRLRPSWLTRATRSRSHSRLYPLIPRYGIPEIFHTEGSQFTSSQFTDLLTQNGIAISMDGKGAWRDNVFVERLWKTIKYEEVYLHAYDSVSDAKARLARYIDFYNRRRRHRALDGVTPDAVYFQWLPIPFAA